MSLNAWQATFAAITMTTLAALPATAQDAPPAGGDAATGTEQAAGNQGCAGPCSLTAGEYYLRLPDGAGPFPAVVFLHNAGETGAEVLDTPLVERLVLSMGYAAIAPQGLTQRFAGGEEAAGWRLTGTQTGGRDDLVFLETVLDDAAARHGIDRDRVLLTGYGLGASLVWEAACFAPETANAYAPRDGGFWGALPEECAAPVRLMHVHAPAPGGWPLTEPAEGAEGIASQQPIQSHLELARRANGCGESTPLTAGLPEGHDGLAWEDCTDTAELQLVLHGANGRTTEALFRHVLDWFAATQATN
ncbi:MAG: dienelactone hydrolase family protein [Pseudomonadota bacterium]